MCRYCKTRRTLAFTVSVSSPETALCSFKKSGSSRRTRTRPLGRSLRCQKARRLLVCMDTTMKLTFVALAFRSGNPVLPLPIQLHTEKVSHQCHSERNKRDINDQIRSQTELPAPRLYTYVLDRLKFRMFTNSLFRMLFLTDLM